MLASGPDDDVIAVSSSPEDLDLATEHQDKAGIPVADIPQKHAVGDLVFPAVAAHHVDLVFGQLWVELVVPSLRACGPGGGASLDLIRFSLMFI
jgi:hypothetical protein